MMEMMCGFGILFGKNLKQHDAGDISFGPWAVKEKKNNNRDHLDLYTFIQ